MQDENDEQVAAHEHQASLDTADEPDALEEEEGVPGEAVHAAPARGADQG